MNFLMVIMVMDFTMAFTPGGYGCYTVTTTTATATTTTTPTNNNNNNNK